MSDLVSQNLNMIFKSPKGETVHALKDISFSLKKGELLTVLGPSGCGKTTLLNIAAGFLRPTSGNIILGNNEINGPGVERGMVFQQGALFEWLTVNENVNFGLRMKKEDPITTAKKVEEWLDIVGLKGFGNTPTYQLSGGMQQRVGLARALATNPGILLMDEAFSALDPLIRSDMQKQLLELQSELKKTIFFITHDLDESLKLGDHIGILNHGRLVQVGTPEDIIMNPADDYVAAFVKDVNRAKVLRARTVMVKPDKFNGKEVKLSESYKVNEDTYIEEFLPKVLQDRSTIIVVDNKGDTKGYITEKELAISLSKTSHNEPAKTF